MKNILFIVNHLKNGGIEQVLLDYVLLLKNDYNITVLSIYHSESYYQSEINKQVKYFSLDILRTKIKMHLLKSVYSRLFDRISIQKLLVKKFIKKNLYETIIAFSDGTSIELTASIFPKNFKKIAWVHTDFLEDEHIINYKKLRSLYNKFDEVIFVSNKLKQKFEKKLHISKSLLIYNPLNIKRFQLSHNENKLPINKFNFIAIGRLSWEKGFDRIIKSYYKLPDSIKKTCHLFIIGDGPEQNNLRKLIQICNLEENITLTGYVANPFNQYRQANVLLVPSRFEGFGLVIIEALYNGIPVIATQTTGANEILCNGKYGVLLKNTDTAFDDILLEVYKNPSLIYRYKDTMQQALLRFNIENIKEQLLQVL